MGEPWNYGWTFKLWLSFELWMSFWIMDALFKYKWTFELWVKFGIMDELLGLGMTKSNSQLLGLGKGMKTKFPTVKKGKWHIISQKNMGMQLGILNASSTFITILSLSSGTNSYLAFSLNRFVLFKANSKRVHRTYIVSQYILKYFWVV